MKGLLDRIRILGGKGATAAPAIVETWEPCLRLDPPSPVPVLYEPDGPLYAICLQPEVEVATDRRRVLLSPLDLIVVAPGLALDVSPAAPFLVLRHLGTPPPHFRERFIQVWGFEHRPAAEGPLVLDPEVAGHRVRYEILDLSTGPGTLTLPPHARGILLAPECSLTVAAGSGDEPGVTLPTGTIALVEPETTLAPRGEGRVGLLTVIPEPLYEARTLERRRRGQTARVDYSPPTGHFNAPQNEGDREQGDPAR